MKTDEIVLEELLQLLSENKMMLFNKIAKERTDYIHVVVENLYQAHNASAVLRTCDCYGIQKMHVIENKNKYKVNHDIALGAGKWVETETHHQGVNPTIECIQTLKKKGYKIVATTPHTHDFDIYNVPLKEPIAVFFGTEMDGLSKDVLEEADYKVNIPMYGFTESFNISVSVSLCLQHLTYKMRNSAVNWRMTQEEQDKTLLQWLRNSIKSSAQIEKKYLKLQSEK